MRPARAGKDLLRRCVRAAVGAAGSLSPAVRRARRHGLTSFVFHDIGTAPSPFAREHALCVPPAVFARQARWIASHYSVVHPDELLENRPLPPDAALITFDDGWAGTFEHGMPILAELNLPSIVFLNCGAIAGEPFVASVAIFLGRHRDFAAFAAANGLTPPYHLTLTPALLAAFEAERGASWRDAYAGYQGRLTDWDTVLKWDGRPDVRFGNHLFNHWNAAAISDGELVSFYRRNQDCLARLSSARPIFAFPNGQPGTCFRPESVVLLRGQGAQRLFAATGAISPDAGAVLLDRIALTDAHASTPAMWYAVSRTALRGGGAAKL